ncbi:MAG: hypothetical protein A4E73_00491 [Syntrophaceae bacterium PtaU1.Bin231]|nr:MAG: hypothetical protein A4E73_00491 [Syntrophaceae bacterium PtaU1.Bin231]
MRLFKRGDWWHIETRRGSSKAIKTKDEAEARAFFKELTRQHVKVVGEKAHKLSDLRKAFVQRAGMSRWTTVKDALSLKLFGETIGDPHLHTISFSDLEHFKKKCLVRGTKPVTVNGYLRHIKAAFNFAKDAGWIKSTPKIKMVPVGKTPPRYLTPDEINGILQCAKRESEDLGRLFTFMGSSDFVVQLNRDKSL